MSATEPVVADGPQARVAPSLGRGLLVLLVYLAIALGGELGSGVDTEDLDAAADVVKGIVVPVGLGVLAVVIIGRRWRWPDVLTERPELRLPARRELRLIPAAFALVVALALVTAPWSDWATEAVLLLLVGMILVGAGEESVFRGFVLVGARARLSEAGACLVTCGLFGLVHAANLLAGQAIGPTLGQVVINALLGAGFYLLRRMSGLLAVPIVAHGLWNFAFYLHASA